MHFHCETVLISYVENRSVRLCAIRGACSTHSPTTIRRVDRKMESARSDQGSNVAEFGVAIGGRPGKGAQLRLTQRNIVEFGSDRLSRLAQAASVVAPSGHAAGSAFSPKAHR